MVEHLSGPAHIKGRVQEEQLYINKRLSFIFFLLAMLKHQKLYAIKSAVTFIGYHFWSPLSGSQRRRLQRVLLKIFLLQKRVKPCLFRKVLFFVYSINSIMALHKYYRWKADIGIYVNLKIVLVPDQSYVIHGETMQSV